MRRLKVLDLIIIGAGPAGLTAAIYAGRSRLNTLILEKLSVGGRILMSETIENYPGFSMVTTQELIRRMEEQVRALDVKIEAAQVEGIDIKNKTVTADGKDYKAQALIIATGAKPRMLNCPGETRFTGKGVSYCATCDAPFFKEKHVAIVGGGNAVAEEAIYLARFARQVSIIHRRDELRASAILQEKLKENKKIKFILSSVVTEIKGAAKVESVSVKNVLTGEGKDLSCDGVFIYIGYDPDTEFLKGKLNLDENGFIISPEDMTTSAQGVFACGDCRKKTLYQVVTACADGAIAADSVYKYLASKGK
ncbi:MAG: thioredoxin-disulfide reductase [Candidatus Omnitrophica bacterium]|nr:thioredoxin-disulfide reductase [Candidatus Omnitrophota bacterium]